MRNRHRLLAASALAALGLWLLVRQPDASSRVQERARSMPASAPAARLTPPPTPIATGDFTADAWQKRLDEYRRAAVYPWWSRPHDDGTRHLLAWNQPVVSELPFSDTPGSETRYHFAADKMHVPYGEALTSWIEVWKTGRQTERVPAKVRQAWVMATDGGRMMPLTFTDDGTLRYTNRFVPSEHTELAQSRQVRIVAEVESAGQTRLLVRDFTYAPRDVLRVVGISDAIADGSLVVTLDVEAAEAGTYTFQANLLGGEGQIPLAWSDIGAQLGAGRSRVRLTFFGKVLRDQLHNGPYVMCDLRGFLHKDDLEHNIWWSSPGRYRTAPYRATDFSVAEWDSAEKREKLQSMQDIIDKTASGQMIGSPHIHIGEDGVARQIFP